MSTTGIFDALIIGAGFSGLGSAIRLQQAGINNIAILERAAAVGGTWRDNQYPGAACDIPSNLYSFSFAKNPNWPESYSGSAAILDYVHSLVERFDLEPLIRFNHSVTQLHFDDAQGYWNVRCENGSHYRAKSVVMAQGPLSNAGLPAIDGLEDFQGQKIHSARWDHDYDFSGKRVAVIGTGASAVQIVPELVKQASHVKVFQRTPGWVLPKPNPQTSDWNKKLFARFPSTQAATRELLYWGHETAAFAVIWDTPVTRLAERLATRYLKKAVADPWLRRQLQPDYKLGCKRILLSSDYYPALQQQNCQLISWPIAKIAESGIRTADGLEHQLDCIVFATGFDVSKTGTPFEIIGSNGKPLAEQWARGAQAFKSCSVAGYPNLFLTFGPNSGPGHNSALVYIEAQIDYLVSGIKTLLHQQLKSLDVKPDVQQRHNRSLQKRLAKTNWNSGCKSWYLTEDGFNPSMYPGYATQYRQQMRLDTSDYILQR